jgi:hypothetical protein
MQTAAYYGRLWFCGGAIKLTCVSYCCLQVTTETNIASIIVSIIANKQIPLLEPLKPLKGIASGDLLCKNFNMLLRTLLTAPDAPSWLNR